MVVASAAPVDALWHPRPTRNHDGSLRTVTTRSIIGAMGREAFIARRRHLDFTQESLAHRLNVATATVAKWENGTRLPAPGTRRNLAEALEVSLIDLDRLLGIEPPIEFNGHRVPHWLNTYESLVQAAGRLCEVEFIAIPALLQTKAYAAAVERAGDLLFTDHEVVERVDLRSERQKVLYRDPEPLQLVTLLGEGVLRDRVGSRDVMAEQLDHLAELAERPNIDLRMIGPGRAPSAIGGFELLTRPGDIDPFMAATLDVGGARYREDPDVVAKFVSRFNHLLDTALTPSETTRRIRDMRKTHR